MFVGRIVFGNTGVEIMAIIVLLFCEKSIQSDVTLKPVTATLN